jgi:serine/threonine-protein kinase SRPK3
MKLIGPLPERWKPYWNPKPFEDSNGVCFLWPAIASLTLIFPGNLIVDPDTQWRMKWRSKWRNELEGSKWILTDSDSYTAQRTTRVDGELDADEDVQNFVDLLRMM